MEQPRLQRISNGVGFAWRVSYAGMERDFAEDWKAMDFYHQLLSRSTSPESLMRGIRSSKSGC